LALEPLRSGGRSLTRAWRLLILTKSLYTLGNLVMLPLIKKIGMV
jgi:hypothetical protein